DALQLGGLEELAPDAVQQAEVTYKKLQSSLSNSDFPTNPRQRQLVRELGFVDTANPPTTEQLTPTANSLLSLIQEPQGPAATGAPPNATSPGQDFVVPDASLIVASIRQELRRDPRPENWDRQGQIVKRLQMRGAFPLTSESQFLRDI